MNVSDTLYAAALEAFKNAYAPYSKFNVGAAVLSASGKVYAGCNVENVSYPCGTCAEQSALSAMVSAGETTVAEILILAGGNELISPCGACLQRIKELALPNIKIHLADLNGIQQTLTMGELLPHAFTAKELQND